MARISSEQCSARFAGSKMLCCEERSAVLPLYLSDAALVGVVAGGLRLNRGTTWGRNLFANRASSQALLAAR